MRNVRVPVQLPPLVVARSAPVAIDPAILSRPKWASSRADVLGGRNLPFPTGDAERVTLAFACYRGLTVTRRTRTGKLHLSRPSHV